MTKEGYYGFCDRCVDFLFPISMALCASMLVVAIAHVVMRYVFNSALSWSEEFLRFAMVWFTLLSAAILHHRNGHVGIVIFRDTKNRSDHRLPIPPFAMELLKQRREMAEDGERGKWVFPARSRLSEKGHYSDSSELLDGIRESAGIAKLTMHDLRRTFGRLVDDLGVPYFAMKRLLNHGVLSDPTSFYASTEWTRLGEHLARAEDALLRTSPTVYNSLRPLNTPPIP